MKLINMLGSAAFLGIAILCILMTVAEAEAAITLSQDSIASATPTTMDTSSSMAFDHTDQDNKADSMMDDGTKLKKRDYWSTVLLRYDLRCDPAAAETFPHRNHLPPYTPYTMTTICQQFFRCDLAGNKWVKRLRPGASQLEAQRHWDACDRDCQCEIVDNPVKHYNYNFGCINPSGAWVEGSVGRHGLASTKRDDEDHHHELVVRSDDGFALHAHHGPARKKEAAAS